jgi:hypothetical protein
MLQFLVAANVIPSSLILFTLMMEAKRFSVTSVLTRAKQHQISEASCLFQLLVTANVPSSVILFTLMMEAIRSSDTSVLIRLTRDNIPEDVTLHSHRRESLKS